MTVKVTGKHMGTGGILTYTGPSKDEVRAAAENGVKSIDYMSSPYISLQPFERSPGEWVAEVKYYGLD